MKIVQALPPLIDEIDAAFGVKGKPVIFAWGDTIYDPQGVGVSPALMAHESVHGKQQGKDIEAWWRRYIAEPWFRLEQEIEAHRAEYDWHARQPDADKPCKGFRSKRLFHQFSIARRLAGPLYGNLITVEHARSHLRAAA